MEFRWVSIAIVKLLDRQTQNLGDESGVEVWSLSLVLLGSTVQVVVDAAMGASEDDNRAE
jgi:hypothetical protein